MGGEKLEFLKDDFLTPKPYEAVAVIKDPFQRQIFIKQLSDYAISIGFKGFAKQLQAYERSLKHQNDTIYIANKTDFEGQTIELDAGDWRANDYGISRNNGSYEEIACTHPILPIEKYKNINTGELKIKLVFRRGDKNKKLWCEVVVDFDTISNAKNILNLAKIGVSVSSGRKSQCLVDYLNDIIDLNYDTIPQFLSTTKMGWSEEGFSPYVENLIFDGERSFGRIYNTISEHGKYKAWLDEAKAVRIESIQAKVALAASFASVLLEPLGLLPFFVHLWGSESGTGKTVGLMLAASIWANPELGKYIQTFRSTSVGTEIIAGFLNSLPVIIDELQLARDNRGKIMFNVYELAAGVGKLRSNKTLGIADTLTWNNCFITSGESPIVSDSDGAGAVGRVIEIECKSSQKIISNGIKTSSILKSNYGFAGKMFIERLAKLDRDDLIAKYDLVKDEMLKVDTDDKQALSASVLLLADQLATDWIFKDDNGLKFDEVAELLKSKSASSIGDRAYDLICDWVATNSNVSEYKKSEEACTISEGCAFIVPSVFNNVLTEAGFNAKSVLSQFKTKELIKYDKGHNTKNKRIGAIIIKCICVKMPILSEEIEYEFD